MENNIITTPSGYQVTLRDLTFGEYEDIQNMMVQGMKINPATGKPDTVDASIIGTANAKLRELMIVNITKDGAEVEKDIRKLPRRDGACIQQEIDKLTQDTAPDQKKGM